MIEEPTGTDSDSRDSFGEEEEDDEQKLREEDCQSARSTPTLTIPLGQKGIRTLVATLPAVEVRGVRLEALLEEEEVAVGVGVARWVEAAGLGQRRQTGWHQQACSRDRVCRKVVGGVRGACGREAL